MKVEDITINSKIVRGIEIPLQNSVLILLIAQKGYIACGYWNIATAEKFGDAACIVRGVKTLKDALSSKVAEVSSGAEKLGIKTGMSVIEALEKLL